jgi:hypothetical protein
MAGRAEADVVVRVSVAVAADGDDRVEVEAVADDDGFADAAATAAMVVTVADGVHVDCRCVVRAVVVRRGRRPVGVVGGGCVDVTVVAERDAVPGTPGFRWNEVASFDDGRETVLSAVVAILAEDQVARREDAVAPSDGRNAVGRRLLESGEDVLGLHRVDERTAAT